MPEVKDSKTNKNVKYVEVKPKTNTTYNNTKYNNTKYNDTKYKKDEVNLLVEDDDSEIEESEIKRKTIRLSETGWKPKTSESTSPEELKQKLINYKRVDPDKVKDIPLGTHVKYVEVIDTGKFKYKPGGFITFNQAPTYLILVENGKSWSVQLSNHIIFVEQFHYVRKEYEDKIAALEKQVESLKKQIRISSVSKK